MSGIDPRAFQDNSPKYIDKVRLPFLKQWWRNLNQRLFANTYVIDQLNKKTEEKYFIQIPNESLEIMLSADYSNFNFQSKYPECCIFFTPGYISRPNYWSYHCQEFCLQYRYYILYSLYI